MIKLIKQIIDDLVTPIWEDIKQTPLWLRWIVIVVTCAAPIPLTLIFRARTTYNDKPRIHIIQNMDNQPKYVSQERNDMFLDGRAMRPHLEGTIARGGMVGDTHFFMGIVEDDWATRVSRKFDCRPCFY